MCNGLSCLHKMRVILLEYIPLYLKPWTSLSGRVTCWYCYKLSKDYMQIIYLKSLFKIDYTVLDYRTSNVCGVPAWLWPADVASVPSLLHCACVEEVIVFFVFLFFRSKSLLRENKSLLWESFSLLRENKSLLWENKSLFRETFS